MKSGKYASEIDAVLARLDAIVGGLASVKETIESDRRYNSDARKRQAEQLDALQAELEQVKARLSKEDV